MGSVKQPRKNAKEKAAEPALDPASSEKAPDAPAPKKLSRKALVRKAYERVEARLEKGKETSKAIDDLVKLVKLEKDLGGKEKPVKEVKVRWEEGKDESSSEE